MKSDRPDLLFLRQKTAKRNRASLGKCLRRKRGNRCLCHSQKRVGALPFDGNGREETPRQLKCIHPSLTIYGRLHNQALSHLVVEKRFGDGERSSHLLPSGDLAERERMGNHPDGRLNLQPLDLIHLLPLLLFDLSQWGSP